MLRHLFEAAVASAAPSQCVPRWLPSPPTGRTVVIGAGKASAAMAQAVEAHWEGPLSGLVITRHGHTAPCQRVTVEQAGHPVPDQAGVDATTRMQALLQGLTADDLVIALMSGGGSALLSAPPPGISLADDQALAKALLKSGATIAEINCVRKHLSLVKGGRLALAARPARVVTLAISDVPGDDPATIASGPTVPDPTTRAQAMAIIERYSLSVPDRIRYWLADPACETPKPGSFLPECQVIATPQMALEAAAAAARELGYTAVILGDAIEGEAREVARMHAGIVRQIRERGDPVRGPCVLLSGGETTVTVRGDGRGGRNAEFMLALALELNGMFDIHALAADTDGIDGTEANAGAVIGPDILARGTAAGVSAAHYLARNDAYTFFERTNALVMTGPTLTNVNDFRAVLIEHVD
ncbi:glycerate kinase type-2 family protein [Blastomonas sp.]|uniref:glycerate kinase type-2 family protein n=1 Tax=Blastomonas sp. TaxID=1909299 RepID=UPI00406A1FF5